jgi:PhnB protein
LFKVNPYLCFDGQAEAAMGFYQSVLGGELNISRFSNLPTNDGPDLSAEQAQRVLHAVLFLSDGTALMASDTAPWQNPAQWVQGNHLSISLNLVDQSAEARRLFEGLSQGGTILAAFEPQFWGAEFGMFRDRFGVQWMINSEIPAKSST